MQKRSDANKEIKYYFRTKVRNTAVVVFCILFALSAIYAVDVTTGKLSLDDSSGYAVSVTKTDSSVLQFHIAGKQYHIDLSKIKAQADKLKEKTDSVLKEIKNFIN